jgi:ribonuclease E
LPIDEVNFNLLPSRGDSRGGGRIGQHLQAGQRIMAQVVREPFSGKPPTVSTYFSLPGRYLVLMPGVEAAGVSRKIEDPKQRERLKKIAQELKPPSGFGLIVRTAGLGQTKAELQRDLRYLLRLWQSVQRASQAVEFPALVYREADLVIRTIRDHLSADIAEVWIDSQETYDKALAFVRDVVPGRAKILRLYTGDRPLFNKFNLEDQIESIYKRRVTLPSGGEIVIDGTEAFTAVDVNSARAKRTSDAEDNATQTNLEAASEIARQLRLRDLGGLVVIDFIDMLSMKNRKKVEEMMRAAMRGDRARHDMTRISKMGLMEIARQRLKAAKMSVVYTACPTCEGYGLIKNLEAAAIAALRKLQTRSARGDAGRIRLSVPPDVANWMLNNKRDEVVQVERRQRLSVDIAPEPKLLRHEAKLETFPREAATEPTPRVVNDRVPPTPPSEQELARSPGTAVSRPVASNDGDEATPAAEPRKRRRRRRKPAPRKPGDERETATEPTTTQTESKIVPFAPPASTEAGGSPAETQAPETGTDQAEAATGEPVRRKRRRRRRRSSAASAPPAAGSGAAQEPEKRQSGEDGVVPAGVRADELMPAAAGSGRKRRGDSTGHRRRGRAGGTE